VSINDNDNQDDNGVDGASLLPLDKTGNTTADMSID